MKPEKIEARQCLCCGSFVSEEDPEGLEAHGYDAGLVAYACGECGEVYDDRDEAKECCR